MTAIGASLPLLPVATRRSVGNARWPAAIGWLYAPGVAVLALGMGIASPALLAAGAAATVGALSAYAVLLARNLAAARGMPAVVAHGWAALAALVVVIVTALSLAGAYLGAPGLDRATAQGLHIAYATYGFMGMLALGLSYLLVPMFALAPLPNTNKQGLTPFRSALRAVIRRGRPPAIDPDQWLRKAAGGILVSVYHYWARHDVPP